MIRSWLFVPADDERKIAKAFASTAGIVIVDLEDAVGPSPARKAAGREVVRKHLAGHFGHRARCFVRINGLAPELASLDIPVAVESGVAGVVLPKCEGPGDVGRLAKLLDKAEKMAGCEAGRTGIVGIVTETARGVQMLADFRDPIERLVGLMWGAEDLSADLGGTDNRDADRAYLAPYRVARDACLFAARAVGVSAIDAVYPDFRDVEGLARESRAHRMLGFDAKAAIHPGQLAAIEEAFAPTADERAWAQRVIAAFGASEGVVQLDGVMLDVPHLKRARQILA